MSTENALYKPPQWLKIKVFLQARLKISVSGIWNLGCNPYFWMDHWVCGTVHAFNQI